LTKIGNSSKKIKRQKDIARKTRAGRQIWMDARTKQSKQFKLYCTVLYWTSQHWIKKTKKG